jgi:hypothetical protein
MRYQDPDSFFQTRSSPGCPPGSFPVTPDPVYGLQATAPRTKVLCRCCLLAARAAIRVYASAWLRCRRRHDSSSGLLIRRYRMG